MKMIYFGDTDTLSIELLDERSEGQDTQDPDVTLFFDGKNRVSEILIESASERVDLERLRQSPAFSVHEPAPAMGNR